MENEFGGAGSYNQEFQTAVQDLLSNLLGGQQINSQQPTTEGETEETTAPEGMRTWSSRLGNGHVSVSVGTMSPEEMRRAFSSDDPQQRAHMFIDPEENAPMSFGNLLNSLMGVLTNGPQREGAAFFGATGGSNFGDYVWGQRNFDDIITQIMEQHQGAHAPPPASEETIGKLPQHKITQEEEEERKSRGECGICMEEYKVDELAVELPCKHMYHKECIDHWLGMNGTCPICRARIGPEPKPKPKPPRSHSEMPGSFPQQTNQPDHEPLD